MMTKTVDITIDIKIARRMLAVAGFSYEETQQATDDEIFARVLTLIDCYGATFKIREE